ncbi:MAG: type II 3-dehydroquinate dehydratase [Clostridia bacterium]|nr:type II 3-dehydroquinate dehydratase [Clostridia bacterium]
MKLLVLNGPNLNLLGKRKPEIYGKRTLNEIMGELEAYLNEKGAEAEFFQSNNEGELIDRIHAAIGTADGIIFNPGAYSHYSYALRDAIESVDIPCVEVHLSDIHNRESFRAISVIEPVCIAQVSALGERSYFVGAEILLSRLGG